MLQNPDRTSASSVSDRVTLVAGPSSGTKQPGPTANVAGGGRGVTPDLGGRFIGNDNVCHLGLKSVADQMKVKPSDQSIVVNMMSFMERMESNNQLLVDIMQQQQMQLQQSQQRVLATGSVSD